MALKLLPEDLSDVPSHLADRYEAQAGRYWDLFYRRNTTKFFKDRHYLHKEFPDLTAGPATLLEVGCGVGNTVFPLLEINPALKVYCCDFAPSAIELVRQNPQYGASGGAVQAFVADITSDMLAAPPGEGGCGVPEGGCDLATMIFVLSAIHPHRMAAAIHNVARCLRPGSGRLLFRDYAEGDLAQERLAGGDRPKRLGPNFYVRGDGTRCYYFSQPEVLALFASAGFVCDSVTLHERTVVNHKRDIAMDRRWLQAIFTLRQLMPPPLPLRELLAQPTPPCQQQQNQQPHQQPQPATSAAGAAVSGGDGGMEVDMANAAGPTQPDAFQGSTAAAAAAMAAAFAAPSDPLLPSGLYGGSWLTGAAGRLASHLAAGPGQPSGRALLPESLDSADDLRAQLSPISPNYHNHHNHNHHKRHQGPQPDAAVGSGGGGAWPTQQFSPGAVGGAGTAEDGAGGGLYADGDVDMRFGDGDGGAQGECTAAPAAAVAARGRRRSMSGSSGGDGDGRTLESELEAEFFATIGRDSAEVAAEEVAAAGAALARVRLVDVAEMAAARLAAASSGRSAVGGGGGPPHSGDRERPQAGIHDLSHSQQSLSHHQQQLQQPLSRPAVADQEAEVAVAAGVSFRCLLSLGPGAAGSNPSAAAAAVPPAALALARVLLASPRLLAGRCALQLGPATRPTAVPLPPPPSAAAAAAAAVLPAMAAVRGSARRVVVSDAGREGLAAAAADLRRNAHLVVIERLRLVTLDWAAAASSTTTTSAAAAVGGLSSGYTYVPGAVRQLRDVLQIQPTGYDIVYAADPLREITTAAAAAAALGGPAAGGDVAIATARALFHVADQLVVGDCCGSLTGAAAGEAAATAAAGRQRGLLLLCVPGAWAAVHGMGFAALAAVCGWELLVPEQLAELYGANVGAAAALGCAALAFRRRSAVCA